MMQQNRIRQVTPRSRTAWRSVRRAHGAAPAPRATVRAGAPELLTPADVGKAIGVPEADVMAIIESGELTAQEDRRELAHHARGAQQVPRELVIRARAMTRLSRRPVQVTARGREIPVPGVRRAGGVEPGEAEAGVPVLRHRVAVPDRSRPPAQSPRAIWPTLRELPRHAARLAGGEAQRAVPELPGGDGVRPVARRAELRVLRIAGAGGLRRDQGSDQPAEPAAVPRARHERARSSIRRWYAQQVVRARQAASRARSSTRCTASTCRTGPSTRRRTARGAPRRATTTTRRELPRRPGPASRRARCSTSAGSRRPARVDHFFDDELVPGSQGRAARRCCGDRAVSDEGARAVRRGDGVRLRRRALPGGADRRRAGARSIR